ncbi:CACTA en-spm transposon protein [Cucumis melo var. makuwa]|uniref:CACTA en-spm transposon protein n=1 Tax=Cucumis melo var. makuwa TaxID=1194695 RepID=A0A5A7UF69_CUCMM|nr:CACTA en-spm transposon protein [Cucumis melo var. makuwa]TYK27567.1 CACTA en-spm transposon protein [Cucumis melo var. makuwa]
MRGGGGEGGCIENLMGVPPKYIEVVKDVLQHYFVLDFNDQVLTRFVEHQMLISFKEFKGDCHKHFKKTNKAARQKQPYTIVTGQSRFYNDNMSSLNNEVSQSTVWSYLETYARSGQFVSQVATDAHNQMLKLQSQPTPKGF